MSAVFRIREVLLRSRIPGLYGCTTGLRIWIRLWIRTLLFSSVAFKMTTKISLKKSFVLITCCRYGTIKSVLEVTKL
jgi:hypothetical protein